MSLPAKSPFPTIKPLLSMTSPRCCARPELTLKMTALLMPPGNDRKSGVMAVVGKAGSGKTCLLAELLQGAGRVRGSHVISGDLREPQNPG